MVLKPFFRQLNISVVRWTFLPAACLVFNSLIFRIYTKKKKCQNSVLDKTKSIILELHMILNLKKTKTIFLVAFFLNNGVIHFISLPIRAPFFTVKPITTFIPSKCNFLQMNRINRWHNLFKALLCLLLFSIVLQPKIWLKLKSKKTKFKKGVRIIVLYEKQ